MWLFVSLILLGTLTVLLSLAGASYIAGKPEIIGYVFRGT